MDATYINVDLSPGSAPGVLNVSQNDAGRPLGVKLFLNGAAFTLTGYGATVETLKPDGNLVTIAGTVSGNTITWSTTEQQTAVAGKCMSEVRITNGSADIGSANFILMVESSPEAEGVESESEIASITEQVEALVAASTAQTYDPTSTAPQSGIAVAQGIGDLKSAIDDIREDIYDVRLYDWAELNAPSGYGWNSGYYNKTTGNHAGSGYFCCNYNGTWVDLTDVDRVVAIPPTGYGIMVHAYRNDSSFVLYGDANTQTNPSAIGQTVEFDADEFVKCKLSVGRFATTSSSTYYDDPEWVATIKLFLYTSKVKDIDVIEAKTSIVPDPIKSYYETEMETTVASVKALMTEPCLVFPLCTDIHYLSKDSTNFVRMIENMAEFTKHIRCDGLICLGDLTDGGQNDSSATKAVTGQRAEYMMNAMRNIGIPLLFCVGNHDDNRYKSTDQFTLSELYEHYYSKSYNDVEWNVVNSGVDYYIDFPQYKIRMFSLCTDRPGGYGYPTDTRVWFENSMASVPEGYIVVVLQHISVYGTQNLGGTAPSNAQNVYTSLEAFVNNGGTVIQLYGHSHADMAFTSPFLSIATCCQKRENLETDEPTYYAQLPEGAVTWERPEGTAAEDCWDVVVIRPTSKHIDMVRFGAGQDRSFTYGT